MEDWNIPFDFGKGARMSLLLLRQLTPKRV